MEHLNRSFSIAVIMLSIMAMGLLQACYYDNEEYLYPASANCETENMSFDNNVWPVINANCIGCHSGANPSGGISLENYTAVSTAAGIDPGFYGSLYGAISHSSGNSPMPKNSDKLSDCTIAQIKAWIEQGAQDN